MKNTLIKTLAVAAFACGLAKAATPVNKGCSVTSLKGSFAYKGTGTIVTPPVVAGPIANVMALTFDGIGAVSGSGVLSQNGNIIPVTVAGSYVMNADCTGTYSIQYAPLGITSTFTFVMDNSGSDMMIICMDSGVVLDGIARRQFPVGDWRQ